MFNVDIRACGGESKRMLYSLLLCKSLFLTFPHRLFKKIQEWNFNKTIKKRSHHIDSLGVLLVQKFKDPIEIIF
jgi:hypothetical protein